MPATRQKLYCVRQHRAAPARDDKMLTDWNGLTITALAEAAQIFARPDWLMMAENAFAAIITHSKRDDGCSPMLATRMRQAGRKKLDVALAADHGCMIEAACALYQASGENTYLQHAENWAGRLQSAFGDTLQSGGYFVGEARLTDIGGAHLLVRQRPVHDGAQPSANAAILAGLAALANTGNPAWRVQGDKLFTALGGQLATQYPSMTALLAAYHHLHNGVSVTIIADKNNAVSKQAGAALYRAVCDGPHDGIKPYDNVALVWHGLDENVPPTIPPMAKPCQAAIRRSPIFAPASIVCRQ